MEKDCNSANPIHLLPIIDWKESSRVRKINAAIVQLEMIKMRLLDISSNELCTKFEMTTNDREYISYGGD